MNLENRIILTQKQKLSQRQVQALIQSLQILSLSNTSLHESLQKEYYENPFIEYTPACSNKEDNSFLNFIAAPKKDTIKYFILEQLNPNNFSKKEWILLKYLSGCVDENGFLTITKDELLDMKKFSKNLIEKCIYILQQLEPAGICSNSVEECLIEQLRRKNLLSEKIIYIIQFHLKDIAQNKIKKIITSLHISGQEVQKYIQIISSLNPYPLNGSNCSSSSYIIPDIIVDHTGVITLNDSWMGTYSINDYYVNMIKKSQNASMKEYFKNKYARCYFVIKNIEHRRSTLLIICHAIWNWQSDFFLKNTPILPMTLKDIALQTNLNISTISRAIKGKYLQYPKGTIALKNLFLHSFKKGTITLSKNIIKKYLKEILLLENPLHPYSDTALSQKLSVHFNQSISRRTVTKYRLELDIANSFNRKMI